MSCVCVLVHASEGQYAHFTCRVKPFGGKLSSLLFKNTPAASLLSFEHLPLIILTFPSRRDWPEPLERRYRYRWDKRTRENSSLKPLHTSSSSSQPDLHRGMNLVECVITPRRWPAAAVLSSISRRTKCKETGAVMQSASLRARWECKGQHAILILFLQMAILAKKKKYFFVLNTDKQKVIIY